MKKLFNVNINTNIVVYASDIEEAKNIAFKNIKRHLKSNDISDNERELRITLVKSIKDVPEFWFEDYLPWGIEEDKNIGQILLELKNE